MTAARVVTPEILDALPPEDPRAVRSRRDLVLVNALMGNARGIAAALKENVPGTFSGVDENVPGTFSGGPFRIAELGGGSGHLLAAVARRMPAGRVDALVVDLHPCVRAETRERVKARGWALKTLQADVFEWLAASDAPCDAIVANLFLHHFEDAALRRLLRLAAARTRFFVACEPLRSSFAEFGARLLPLLGCNDVTRHDSVVSVRAGFRDHELSALWPSDGWALKEDSHGLFTHRFVAWRT